MVVVRGQPLDGGLEATLLGDDVLDDAGVAVGLHQRVAALGHVAVAVLPHVLDVAGVLVVHAVLVRVTRLGLAEGGELFKC